MFDFNGSVAVVTGAGSPRGIGRATATLFARRGATVVLADVDAPRLAATVAELRAEGLDASAIETDVSDAAAVQRLADTVFERHGHVDIAFLNAGVGGNACGLFDPEVELWHRVVGINFYGILHGIKAFVPRMVAQGTRGHVLGTSSGAGANGVMYTGPAYAVTKGAVCTLLECLYGQLRDQGSAVRAHVVFPPLTKSNLGGDPENMHYVQASLEAAGVATALAEPEQVAQLVVDAIERDRFFAHVDHEIDQRLFGGHFAPSIDWQDEIIRARARAIVDRQAPDSYLWGPRAG